MMQSVTQFGYSLGKQATPWAALLDGCKLQHLKPSRPHISTKGAEVFNSLNVRWWALLPEIAIDIMNVPSSRVWNATLERYIARPVVFSEMTVVVDLPIPFGASDEQA